MSAKHYMKIIDLLAVPHLAKSTPGVMRDMGSVDLSRIAIELSKQMPDVFMVLHEAVNGTVTDSNSDRLAPVADWDITLLNHIKDKQIVSAIKRYRELTNSDLKSAKDWVDAVNARMSSMKEYCAPVKTMPGISVGKEIGDIVKQNLGDILRARLNEIEDEKLAKSLAGEKYVGEASFS